MFYCAYSHKNRLECTKSKIPAIVSRFDMGGEKVRERLAVGKQAAQRFDRQRFNLRKLNEPDVREQYQIEITNRFAALENDDEDVNRTWENFKENIKISAKESLGLNELKQHKPWFDEVCLSFLDQRDAVGTGSKPKQCR